MSNPSNSRPTLGIWFGNFFEPFYSDRDAVKRGIADVADLGFNSINLDSKAWEDFFARYRGGPASQYVATQEFMMAEMAKHGLDYTHLALYLCGDNLYPNIRDVPPVRGEESIRPDGTPMGTYKYWSPRAQESMVEHVRGLLKLYGKGMRRHADGRLIMQTMFEPLPKPSFDEDGKRKYLIWLEKRYESDIAKLNRRYGLAAKSFSELKPSEYWLRPEELNWVGCARPKADDFARRTPDFYRWIDNQTHLASVLDEYLSAMKKQWRALKPELFIEPVLHQWGYFFNPPGQPDWQTGQRALDVYRCAAHVDGVLFIASPLNAENRADAMALSVEGSIMRNANSHRSFTAGLYLGRHVNGDIYNVVPPAEAYGTHIANGAKSIHTYGYSGLDDGGVMYRMDGPFKESLRKANQWAAEVIPLLDQPRAKEVAILFPAEMSLYEPLELDIEGRHRMDLLGWYAQFIDLGWHVDIVHPDQIADGALTDYQFLAIPHNSLYDLGDNAALEAATKKFIFNGGAIFHGPHCELAKRAFEIREESVEFDCIKWQEEIIPHGWSTVAFQTGKALGTYIQSGKTAIAQTNIGKGRVFSFGFQIGYSYSRRTMPIVPPRYGKREIHPIVLLKETPLAAIIGASPLIPMKPTKGVEFARFGKKIIVVNHRSSSIDISCLAAKTELHLEVTAPGRLAARSAVYIELN
ncbi:MAG TPA: hypothetical protein VGI03_04640 [Verrucomicrobiae bacterium]|jgi:hypothetical protein